VLESADLVTLVPKSLPNLVLDLPSEIRDEISKYALGDAALLFVVSKEALAYAFASASTYREYDRNTGILNGLPVWILTRK
jgi:hypothetical protein